MYWYNKVRLIAKVVNVEKYGVGVYAETLRYYIEYNVHMYGWYALAWAHNNHDYPRLSKLAGRAIDAYVEVGRLDDDPFIVIATILCGILGL